MKNTRKTKQDWQQYISKKDEGVDVPFPSGMTFRVKALGMMAFATMGHIPDHLTPIVVHAVEHGTLPPVKTLDDVRHSTELYDCIATACSVAPAIVGRDEASDPENGVLSVSDLEEEDLIFFTTILGRSTRQLESFRQERQKLMEALDAATENGHTGE
jgi:hypothetical protein